MAIRAGYAFSALLLFAILLASSARAAPVEIDSRAALGGNDFVDWGTLGPVGTSPASFFTWTSNSGLDGTVATVGGAQIFRVDQGNGWSGNFAPGDKLLYAVPTTTVLISFSTPVRGVGAQLQSDMLGGFTITLDALDTGNHLLASFTTTGNSTIDADNSAIFLGLLDDAPTIARIGYVLNFGLNSNVSGFALNRLDMVTASSSLEPVPEPGTLGLLATSLTVFGFAGWLRRPAHHSIS
jgi:hypothetical protein